MDQDAAQLNETPRIFHVNWFRKDDEGKFIWPGFSENMRVLKWIVDRAHGRARRQGNAHRLDAALRRHRVEGHGLPEREVRRAQAFDREAWRKEVIGHEELFIELHDHLPPEIIYERELLICRI